MPVDLSGQWKCIKREGLEEYLKSINASDKFKEVVSTMPELNIIQDGDNFTVTSNRKQDAQSYSIGVPFISEVFGTDIKTVASWEGDKFVMKTTTDAAKYAGKEHITTREIVGGQLVQKASLVGGPVVTSIYEKK